MVEADRKQGAKARSRARMPSEVCPAVICFHKACFQSQRLQPFPKTPSARDQVSYQMSIQSVTLLFTVLC